MTQTIGWTCYATINFGPRELELLEKSFKETIMNITKKDSYKLFPEAAKLAKKGSYFSVLKDSVKGSGLIVDLIRLHYSKKSMKCSDKLWKAIHARYPEVKLTEQWKVDNDGTIKRIELK